MYSESVKGGYRVIDEQDKTTIGQSITALETAWSSLTYEEKVKSAVVVNNIFMRAFKPNGFMFGAIVVASNNAIQNVVAANGLYAASVLTSTGTLNYNDYSTNTTLGSAKLVVFD